MIPRLVIFGAGEIAEVADFYFSLHGFARVEAFVVDDSFAKETTFRGRPLLPMSQLERDFPASRFQAFIALGYREMNLFRAKKFTQLSEMGYELPTYISPNCMNFSRKVGRNGFILEGNVIQPFVEIGDGVTLWSGNHIGHHSVISDHTFISSHVVVSGGVKMGSHCFIGVNSTFRDHISIGESSMVGAGSLVTESLAAGSVVRAPKSSIK